MDKHYMVVKYTTDSRRVKVAITTYNKPLTSSANILQVLSVLPRELRPYCNGLGDSTVDTFGWFICDSETDMETTYHSIGQTPYMNGRIADIPTKLGFSGYVVWDTF